MQRHTFGNYHRMTKNRSFAALHFKTKTETLRRYNELVIITNTVIPGNEAAMLDENCSIDEVRELFANDHFATDACGCRVVEASRGHAVCEFDLADIHRNAQGGIMGGAIFTLADFALAIGCNIGEAATVSVSNTIKFMSAAKGKKLIATCSCDKSGRSLGFYTVNVTDELGTPVAQMSATCFRR